jgi:hypothetical protein
VAPERCQQRRFFLMYSYVANGTTTAVYMNYYTDSACSDFIEEVDYFDLSDFTEDTCLTVAGTSEMMSVDNTVPSSLTAMAGTSSK